MIDSIPDLHGTGAGSGGHFFPRIDNITDEALARFTRHTGHPSPGKTSSSTSVCELLHCPNYRSQFVADLKKMLPRIPLVTDPHPCTRRLHQGRT